MEFRRQAKDTEARARSFEERANSDDGGKGFFGRSMNEVALGRGEGEWQTRRQRDLACPDFLVYVGSRGSLLQVNCCLGACIYISPDSAEATSRR